MRWSAVLVVLAVVAVSCASAGSESAQPTALPTAASSTVTATATPVATATPMPTEPAADMEPEAEIAWSAAETVRDVENYLEALRQGSFEQAAWPAHNNGLLVDGQTGDETGAEALARMCAQDRCHGPYDVNGEPGLINPQTAQASAMATVTHVSGEQATVLLSTFEGQRLITTLPPLVSSGKAPAPLIEMLFDRKPPEYVVIERFDAFEIWTDDTVDWVTNWHAADTVAVAGTAIATGSGVYDLHEPQHRLGPGCSRLLTRGSAVLAIDDCVPDAWQLTNVDTGERTDSRVAYRPPGEAQLSFYVERADTAATGTLDAEGNLTRLSSADGADLLGGDYASLATLSVDGAHIAYVDHRDPAALSHFSSPTVVVRRVDTGAEVGRWNLGGAVMCLEFAVDWLVACEADSFTLSSGQPEQQALVAIDITRGPIKWVPTATRLFLPARAASAE